MYASFNWSGDLKMHKRSITGVKPYKCNIVNVCFSLSDFWRHKKYIEKLNVTNVMFVVICIGL
jgi:hypothetical protein